MKPILAILVLSMTLFADQIFNFDNPLDYEINGDVVFTDQEAMGSAIRIASGDTSSVVIPDVVLPDSFTMVFWVKMGTKANMRKTLEVGSFTIGINGGDMKMFWNGEEFSTHIFIHTNDGIKAYEDELWWPVMWTRRTVIDSSDFFPETLYVDSVFAFSQLAGAKSSKVTGEDTVDIVIGGGWELDQNDPTWFLFDHLCIFDKMATASNYNQIRSLYQVDATKVVRRNRATKEHINSKIIYDVLGRRIVSPVSSIRVEVSDNYKAIRRASWK